MFDFETVVNMVIESPPNDYERSVCPDQFVGCLRSINSYANDFPCRLPLYDESVPADVVLLILESPHKKEFIPPSGPAKGSTGSLIRRFIHQIVSNRVSGNHGLLLVNAIGNQCSLGVATGRFRDTVFQKTWDMYGRRQFIAKLQDLASTKNLFVINACTRGKGGKLRKLVEECVVEALGRSSDVRITHPASWASDSNRTANW